MAHPLKNILITGAGGMLGSDLSALLLPEFNVLGVTRNPASHLRSSCLQADLADSARTSQIVKEFSPQLIFHCAALTNVDDYELHPEEYLAKSAALTKSIVQAANEANAVLVFFSTDYVFDGEKKSPYKEDDLLNPLNVYGRSKAEAERYIKENAETFVIFRVGWLFGLHGKSFPKTILEKSKTQSCFSVVADQVGRPTYTRDIAENLRNILQSFPERMEMLRNNVFHIGNEGTVSWAGLAEFILRRSGSQGSVQPIMAVELGRPAKRPKNSVLDLGKAAELLGLRFRSWEPAVLDFIQTLKG